MSTIKPEDVKRVAEMARLSLSEEEIQSIGAEMDRVLKYAEKMADVDVDGVAPMTHMVHHDENVLRTDDIRPSLPKDQVLMNAPQVQDGYFRVPRIVEE